MFDFYDKYLEFNLTCVRIRELMNMETKETDRLRKERISGTDNGSTLRTRVVRDKTKYTRKKKHKNKEN